MEDMWGSVGWFGECGKVGVVGVGEKGGGKVFDGHLKSIL